MFTGLIEEVGTVRSVSRRGQYARIMISACEIMDDLRVGDSISVDGACQTAVEVSRDLFGIDSLAETLRKSTLGSLEVGRRVNLERAVRAESRLGGHIVQGHVSASATVERVRSQGVNTFLDVRLPEELAVECVSEGSIAVNGVSLTVAQIDDPIVTMNIIPETLRRTNLHGLSTGDRVNVETDIFARYVRRFAERLVPRGSQNPEQIGEHAGRGLTEGNLSLWGYTGGQE